MISHLAIGVIIFCTIVVAAVIAVVLIFKHGKPGPSPPGPSPPGPSPPGPPGPPSTDTHYKCNEIYNCVKTSDPVDNVTVFADIISCHNKCKASSVEKYACSATGCLRTPDGSGPYNDKKVCDDKCTEQPTDDSVKYYCDFALGGCMPVTPTTPTTKPTYSRTACKKICTQRGSCDEVSGTCRPTDNEASLDMDSCNDKCVKQKWYCKDTLDGYAGKCVLGVDYDDGSITYDYQSDCQVACANRKVVVSDVIWTLTADGTTYACDRASCIDSAQNMSLIPIGSKKFGTDTLLKIKFLQDPGSTQDLVYSPRLWALDKDNKMYMTYKSQLKDPNDFQWREFTARPPLMSASATYIALVEDVVNGILFLLAYDGFGNSRTKYIWAANLGKFYIDNADNDFTKNLNIDSITWYSVPFYDSQRNNLEYNSMSSKNGVTMFYGIQDVSMYSHTQGFFVRSAPNSCIENRHTQGTMAYKDGDTNQYRFMGTPWRGHSGTTPLRYYYWQSDNREGNPMMTDEISTGENLGCDPYMALAKTLPDGNSGYNASSQQLPQYVNSGIKNGYIWGLFNGKPVKCKTPCDEHSLSFQWQPVTLPESIKNISFTSII